MLQITHSCLFFLLVHFKRVLLNIKTVSFVLHPTYLRQQKKVGKYLHTATLKIIDTSCFPDDAVQELCHGGNATKVMSVEPAKLVWYFLKCAWSIDAVRVGSKKMIFSLQFGSLVAVLNIFIMLRTVDTLTDPDMAADAKKGLLSIYMLLWIIPFAGMHYLAYRQQFWKVGGSLKKHLQVLLLKK